VLNEERAGKKDGGIDVTLLKLGQKGLAEQSFESGG